MKQMRAGKGAKVRVIASRGDLYSESRRAPTFSKAIADEKSTAPLFAASAEAEKARKWREW
jgi:hypothetical protein